jgi:nucleoside-diphosphate-sugar epimerase
VWGDGSSTKDYLHTSDFLRALDVLIQGKQTGLYNVGRGESVELLRLIEMVEVLTGYAVRIQNLPHYPWDVSQAWIAVDKLSDLGWEPHVSLEKAISLCLKS